MTRHLFVWAHAHTEQSSWPWQKIKNTQKTLPLKTTKLPLLNYRHSRTVNSDTTKRLRQHKFLISSQMIREMTTTVCQYNLLLYNGNSDMGKQQHKVFHENEGSNKHFKDETKHKILIPLQEQTLIEPCRMSWLLWICCAALSPCIRTLSFLLLTMILWECEEKPWT